MILHITQQYTRHVETQTLLEYTASVGHAIILHVCTVFMASEVSSLPLFIIIIIIITSP